MEIKQFTLLQAQNKYSEFIQNQYSEFKQKPIIDIDEKHFLFGFEILVNTETVALCCLYENSFINDEEMQKTLLIGNFECVFSKEIAKVLFKEVSAFAKKNNFQQLIGPMNGSTRNSYRFKVTDSLSFFSESIHQPFYPSFWKENKFEVIETYFSSETLEIDLNEPERMKNFEEKAIKNNVVFRPIDLTKFEIELQQLAKSSLQLFVKNRLYSPISEELFVSKYLPLKTILNADFVWLAQKDHQILAFNLCFRNPFEPSTLIMKTIATKTGKETAGFSYILANKIIQKAKDAGITKIIHAYMHQNNVSNRLSERYSSHIISEYVLFKRTIE